MNFVAGGNGPDPVLTQFTGNGFQAGPFSGEVVRAGDRTFLVFGAGSPGLGPTFSQGTTLNADEFIGAGWQVTVNGRAVLGDSSETTTTTIYLAPNSRTLTRLVVDGSVQYGVEVTDVLPANNLPPALSNGSPWPISGGGWTQHIMRAIQGWQTLGGGLYEPMAFSNDAPGLTFELLTHNGFQVRTVLDANGIIVAMDGTDLSRATGNPRLAGTTVLIDPNGLISVVNSQGQVVANEEIVVTGARPPRPPITSINDMFFAGLSGGAQNALSRFLTSDWDQMQAHYDPENYGRRLACEIMI
jgi:hypothetical protein